MTPTPAPCRTARLAPARVLTPIVVLAALLTVLGWIGSAGLGPVPVGAHTDLLQASPGPGQRAGGEIDFIDLVFIDSISDFRLRLEDPSGAEVDGAVTVDEGQIVRYEMDALSEPGRYIVRFDMTSADGDFTESGFFFDFEPSALEPVRLGDADVPSNTGTIISIAASVVFALCLIGLALLVLQRVEQNRAAATAGEVGGDGIATGDDVGGDGADAVDGAGPGPDGGSGS